MALAKPPASVLSTKCQYHLIIQPSVYLFFDSHFERNNLSIAITISDNLASYIEENLGNTSFALTHIYDL